MQKYKTLDEFFAGQEPEKLEQIMRVQDLVFEAEPSVRETLKWNAPNYEYNGADRLTFNLMNKEGKVKLILHMGATKKEDKNGAPVLADDEGLVEWSSDIRGVVTFDSLEDIEAKKTKLLYVVKGWLEL